MTILEFIASLFAPGHPSGERPSYAFRDTPTCHPYVARWMEDAFDDLTFASQERAPFLLAPCLVNGQPTASIVFVEHEGSRRERWVPLFVACTPAMALTFPPAAPVAPANQP